jgi:hypothetical protein
MPSQTVVLCACGCGEQPPVASKTSTAKGHVEAWLDDRYPQRTYKDLLSEEAA